MSRLALGSRNVTINRIDYLDPQRACVPIESVKNRTGPKQSLMPGPLEHMLITKLRLHYSFGLSQKQTHKPDQESPCQH